MLPANAKRTALKPVVSQAVACAQSPARLDVPAAAL